MMSQQRYNLLKYGKYIEKLELTAQAVYICANNNDVYHLAT